jgi:hemerythrin
VKFLADYAVKHFGHEEHCMDEYRCPAAQANKTAHAQFLQKFTAFRQQLETRSSSDSVIAIQLLRELSDWLVNHIRHVDAQLLPCIKAKR